MCVWLTISMLRTTGWNHSKTNDARAKRLPPTPRPANVRKVDELPWQLLQAADWQKSEQLLTELAFLEAKGEAGMVIDLAADFSAAIGGMSADRPLLRILRLLEEAIRRDIHFIARHPTTLFQCMWNSCWWYDCPEAARHYEASEKGSIFLSSPSAQLARFWHWLLRATHLGSIVLSSQSAQLEPKLSTLLESWRKDKETLTRGWRWVRSLRPPTEQLGTALNRRPPWPQGWRHQRCLQRRRPPHRQRVR